MRPFRFLALLLVFSPISLAQELEQRAAELAAQLQEKPDAKEEQRLQWIGELAKLGSEARSAIPALKGIVEKTDPPEPFFVDEEAMAAARALLAMGDEALPAIRELLAHKRVIVSDTMLRELCDQPFLEVGSLYKVLLKISEEDSSRPDPKVVEAELQANRGKFLGMRLPRRSTGSKSMDDYFRRVDRSRLAIESLLSTEEHRKELQPILLNRLYRKPNPVPWGMEAFPPDSRAILGLRNLALKGEDPESRIMAARALASADPEGKISIPVLIDQLDDDGVVGTANGQVEFMFVDGPLVSSEAISTLRDHPARRTANPSKLFAATERLVQGDERFEWKTQCQAWHLLAQCGATDAKDMLAENIRGGAMRTPGFAAAPLLLLEPDSEETLNQLLKLLDDESKPVSPHTFGGMLPAPIPVRASVARALGFVGEKDREQVLKTLREYLSSTYIPRRGGNPKASHLAAWAAWSIVRLDREDEDALRFLLELEPESDAFSFSRRDLRSALFYESPESVAEVLGDRIQIVQDRLVVQAMQRYEDTNYYVHEPSRDGTFAREILLAAGPPQVAVLVAQAFKDLPSKDYLESSTALALLLELNERKLLKSSFEAIRKELDSKSAPSRSVAAHLLGELQHAPPDSVKALKEATEDPRALVRSRAAKALSKFGSAATEALPDLRALRSDPYESVREAAEAAIEKIVTKE